MGFPFLPNQSDLNERARQQMERANADRRNGIVEPMITGSGADIDWRRFYGPGAMSLIIPVQNTECGYLTTFLGSNVPPEQGTQVVVDHTAKGTYGSHIMGASYQQKVVHHDPESVGRSGNIADGEPLIVDYPDPLWPNG